MSKKKKKKHKKKSEIDWNTWLLGAITDLVIGIVLLILSKYIR